MKSCNGCHYAEWKRTGANRLHPSGDGRCVYQIKLPVAPAAFYWYGLGGKCPMPSGGFISRKETFDEHCPCFKPKE